MSNQPAPQITTEMTLPEVVTTLIQQLHELRVQINTPTSLNETLATMSTNQLSLTNNMAHLIQSLRVVCEKAQINTTAVTNTAEALTKFLHRTESMAPNFNGTLALTSGAPSRDPGFRRWNPSHQSITEWLIDVDGRASLARLAPNDRLAYAKLSLSHLAGHFMALPADVNTNWDAFKVWLTRTFTLPNAPHFLMRELQALYMKDNHLLEYINEFSRISSLVEKTSKIVPEFLRVHFFH